MMTAVRGLFCFDFLQHLNAVLARHLKIGQHDIEGLVLQKLRKFGGIAQSSQPMGTVLRYDSAQKSQHVLLVVQSKN